MLKRILFIIIFLTTIYNLYGASKEETIDSLLVLAKKYKEIDSIALYDICTEGINLCNSSKYEIQLGEFNLYLGYFYHNKPSYLKSYESLETALRIFLKYNKISLIAETYRFMGESNRATRNFDNALVSLDSALKYFRIMKDTIGIAATFNRKAAVFIELNLNDSIKYYANKSNTLLLETDPKNLFIANNYNILGSYYSAKEYNLKKAIENYNKAIEIFKYNNNNAAISHTYSNMCYLHFLNKDFKLAKYYGLIAYNIAKTKEINPYISYSAYNLAIVYKQLHIFDSAFYYLSVYSSSRDSILNEKLIHQINTIQKKFEDEKLLQKVTYENEVNYYRIIILAITIILIGIIAIGFYIKHNEQKKKNKILKENNDIINAQSDKLTELIKNKDLLFSIMAHDLKNPLSSQKLIATVLKEEFTSLSENERLEFIDDIILASESANLLIENLLLWSRSQRDLIQVIYEKYYLKDIFDFVLNILSPNASLKNISLINNIPGELEIVTDFNMLTTIFRNIISNSIKYTNENGKITLNCDCNHSSGFYKFSISDTGIGMNKDEVDNLFHPTLRHTSLGTNNEKGTGLGLLICIDFCKKLNCKLEIESTKNIGTTISIISPIGLDFNFDTEKIT